MEERAYQIHSHSLAYVISCVAVFCFLVDLSPVLHQPLFSVEHNVVLRDVS